MIRRSLLALCLLLALPAATPSPLATWTARMERKNVKASVGIWDLSTGKLIEGYHMDDALVPASVTKVVSTYALLKTWKPNYEIETEVWGDLRGSTVEGDLVFKGAGDPSLVNERIWMLAEDLKARGVKAVTGKVRLDQTAFDDQWYGNGWENTSANTTPAILPLSVNFNKDGGRLVRDPERFAVETITRILKQDGIAVGGAAAPGGEGRKLIAWRSEPLRDMVENINKFSNNFMVEMLVKRFGGGTWPQGVKQIQNFYATVMDLGPDRIQVTDGSGLSKENRLSARTLGTVLRAAWNDFEVGPEMVSSLKIPGGETFNLLKIRDPNLTRRLRCKTGHLNGVDSICGYLEGLHGEERVFAIILNGDCSLQDALELVSRWAN